MIIRHKGIYPDRFEDAPWCGTLISAIGCSFNCSGCINQYKKSTNYITSTTEEIINNISNDRFNEGIILGGLEWSEQPDELFSLVNSALNHNLNVIIYTGLPDIASLLIKVPQLLRFQNLNKVLVKTGRYIDDLRTYDYEVMGVRLASSNQNIEWL